MSTFFPNMTMASGVLFLNCRLIINVEISTPDLITAVFVIHIDGVPEKDEIRIHLLCAKICNPKLFNLRLADRENKQICFVSIKDGTNPEEMQYDISDFDPSRIRGIAAAGRFMFPWILVHFHEYALSGKIDSEQSKWKAKFVIDDIDCFRSFLELASF